MRNFYLYESALQVVSVSDLENGLAQLNDILINKDANRDYFFCHTDVWDFDTNHGKLYELPYSIISKELQRIVPYVLNQFKTQEQLYQTISELDTSFPNDCNSFTGFDFSDTTIPVEKQITELISYTNFINNCLRYGHITSEVQMSENLGILYPEYVFTEQAVEHCFEWKRRDQTMYERLFTLFDDIKQNPFMGGLGQTEVLKHNNGIASKRINQYDRITYKSVQNRVEILACCGHYENL